VSRRTREIGIRMALGAVPSSVLRMVLRQGSLPTAVGVGTGIAASVAASRAIDAMFPTTTGDVTSHLLVVPVVVLVAMAAAYIPARRAALIQPLTALRRD
jgi:putative ABC transport system permease protein